MKNLKFLFCCISILAAFLLAMPAAADMLIDAEPNPTSLVNSGEQTEENWLESLVGTDVVMVGKDETDKEGDEYTGDWTYAILKFGDGNGTGNEFSHYAILNQNDFEVLDLNNIEGLPDLSLLSHTSYFAPVPEPATVLLLGAGIVSLFGYRKCRILKRTKFCI